METATDQDHKIMVTAQARLLEKRKALGLEVMTNPTRLTVSVLNKADECESEEEMLTRLIAESKEREATEELERQRAHEQEFRERKANPERLLKRFGVPPKYLDASFQTFVGGEKAKKFCQMFPEKDTVIHGKTGCGKTHLAVSTLRHMLLQDTIPDGKARFVTAPSLLMEIRDAFKDGATETEKAIVQRYIGYPVLVLDDLGADRGTEWAIETLYLIIDGRDGELKPTMITTNLSNDEIENHYGARIASRIAGKYNFNIDMPDYRKRRA